MKKVEEFFSIENLQIREILEIQHNIIPLHFVRHNLMHHDDYVVKDDYIMIVDEFVGRIMP